MTKLHVTPWHPSGYAVYLDGESPLAESLGELKNPWLFPTLKGAEKFVVECTSSMPGPLEILFHDLSGKIIQRVGK